MKFPSLPRAVMTLAIIKSIFIVSLIFSLFLWSIPIFSLNSNIWLLFQKKSDVALNLEDVKNYNEMIVEFFIKGTKPGFLNENESAHMQDVRKVLAGVNILFTFSFVTFLVNLFYLSKKQKRFVIMMTRNISIGVVLVTLLVTILIMSNFDWTFFGLHKLVFVKNFIFPSSSLLKILYPDEFFYEMSAFYLLSILVVSSIVALTTHRLKLK